MFKVSSIIFFLTVNISQISVFQVDGLFSSAHLHSIEDNFAENAYSQEDLFVIQYSAENYTRGTIDKFNKLIIETSNTENFPKAIWVGPHKISVNADLLERFDYVGFTPGTLIVNVDFSNKNMIDNYCGTNDCNYRDSSILIGQSEGVYKGYLIAASLGGFLNTLGSETIESNLYEKYMESSQKNNYQIVEFGLNKEISNQIIFYKPTLLNRLYIAVSEPAFSFLFFVLGLALIVLELFAMGPGLMAFSGGILLLVSSMTFNELEVNNSGILVLLISFLMYIKVLSRGYFSFMGIGAFFVQLLSSIILFSGSMFKESTEYSLSVNILSLSLVSIGLAVFYFVAIPTVVRSRLTTDNSAITSLVGHEAEYIKKIDNESSLFKLDGIEVKIKHSKNKNFALGEKYITNEEEGSLIIK